jgi:small subunit ribosomal protein S4
VPVVPPRRRKIISEGRPLLQAVVRYRKARHPGSGTTRPDSTQEDTPGIRKVKRIYFVLEKQFRIYFQKASRQKGITGENLLFMLERRLDNAVFRSGFSTSRRQARQLVNHGHILVNGRKVDIPSFQVKVGDVISLKDTSKKNPHVEGAWQTAVGRGRPPWITANDGEITATVSDLPRREDIDGEINEQLIVELYSK